MRISEEDVQHVAALADLELTPAEAVAMRKDLNAVLDHIDQLAELDTSNVEAMSGFSMNDSPLRTLRSDEQRDSLPRDAALSNAPLHDAGFFRVPKVIER